MSSDSEIIGKEKSRILIIDDEARIRDACRMVLEEMGFEISLAADGQQGLATIKERHFDIVFVDLMMPIVSGFEVLAQVKEEHPDTVVVVITGYATIEHSIEAMKKGAFDFIPKPFSPDQLRAVALKSIKYTRALQDITDTKSRLRVMVNRLHDGVMTTDNDKRVVLTNPSFLHLLGVQTDNGIGRQAEQVIPHTILLQMIDEALAMPIGTFKEIVREFSIKDQDGEERILSASCSPFRGRTGVTLGSITVLRDITTIKQMEQMKSDFVSMVSHEIRSPMNSLLMQIKVILDGLAGDVSVKQREILERAAGKIQNLSTMATELLDLARIEAGQIINEKEQIDLATLVDEQILFHRDAAKAKNIQLNREDSLASLQILASRQGIEEVLTNLITNAIKYSPPDGNITVTLAQEENSAVVTVRDTGFGIPPEDLSEIFTRFYRVKDSNTREIHGTGLGLAIVKSIVNAHQGSIKVASKLGEGTSFTVLLPLGSNSISESK